MKKILLIIILFSFSRVYAIENIKINDDNLIPEYNKNTKVYNYYTNKNEVNIYVIKEDNEEVIYDKTISLNESKEVIIESSIYGKYKINILKNYNKNNNEDCYLTDLDIEDYPINFNKEKYEYKISINDESNLNINYDLSNYNCSVLIEGNGNFNKSDNIISIKVDNKYNYIIHVYKTIKVSKIVEEETHEMSNNEKEIVKFIIITISCLIIFGFYYILFINKTILNI